ncbi:major facilitator superfamily-domain-containing protein [Bombardia bombarda]|uniref:Major facilitator superfamily-domain-containing protein n=1 Tax=Bombardia bombarda TaxID=252184 RepID=A0AA39TVZ1_9PEZI|nr:major facilitator superfamily-domain-containing protein [Bombardia bombarda]
MSAPEPAPDPIQTPTEDSFVYITGPKLYAVVASVTLVAFLILLDMSIIATAIPRITADFHSIDDIAWYGAAYNLASAALQPMSGKLYTHLRSKWTFLAFLFVFTLGSLICGVATSSQMFIVGRAIAGLGTSGITNGALTILSNSAPLEKRPFLFGFVTAFGQLGIVFGPLLGGAITQYSTWRWCFYINLPCAAVAAVALVFTAIPERPVELDSSSSSSSYLKTVLSKLDISGFALFAPAAIMFLLGLQYGGSTYPWKSATVIGLLVGAGALFVVFMLWERRQGADAMFPLAMIAKTEVWSSMLNSMFLYGGVVLVSTFYLPIYFQGVKGVSPFMSGLYVLPNIGMTLISALTGGILLRKVGYYVPFAMIGGAAGTIASGLFSTLSPSTSTGQWVGYQIILGIRGIGIQTTIVAVQTVLTPDEISVGMALVIFSQTFGGAIFLAVAGTIFNNSLRELLLEYVPGIDPAALAKAGASGIRDVVSPEDLPAALDAYAKSISRTFYLGLASGILIIATAWGMGWHDIRAKKAVEDGEA